MGYKSFYIAFIVGLLVGPSSGYAQGTQQTPQREEIILTTYYPTPYGDYERMRVNRISVGDTNGDGQRTAEDLPAEDGQLRVAKSVIYNPQGQTPANWFAGTAGELAFSKDEGAFYYYNGSAWVAQGGRGGAMYTLYGTTECPETLGWTLVYSGFAIFPYAYSARGPAGGSTVCNAGADFVPPQPQIHTTTTWQTGGDQFTFGPIPCVVCATK